MSHAKMALSTPSAAQLWEMSMAPGSRECLTACSQTKMQRWWMFCANLAQPFCLSMSCPGSKTSHTAGSAFPYQHQMSPSSQTTMPHQNIFMANFFWTGGGKFVLNICPAASTAVLRKSRQMERDGCTKQQDKKFCGWLILSENRHFFLAKTFWASLLREELGGSYVHVLNTGGVLHCCLLGSGREGVRWMGSQGDCHLFSNFVKQALCFPCFPLASIQSQTGVCSTIQHFVLNRTLPSLLCHFTDKNNNRK